MIRLLRLNSVVPFVLSETARRRNVSSTSLYCQGESSVEDFIDLVRGRKSGALCRAQAPYRRSSVLEGIMNLDTLTKYG
jgi:hypothetical protein